MLCIKNNIMLTLTKTWFPQLAALIDPKKPHLFLFCSCGLLWLSSSSVFSCACALSQINCVLLFCLIFSSISDHIYVHVVSCNCFIDVCICCSDQNEKKWCTG